MNAMTKIVPAARPPRKNALEVSFLPAALEIVESPPSPIGRAVSLTVALFFLMSVVWACVARVDIIATAQGEIVPSGRSKVVQPLEPGVVKEILVEDGQHVVAGQVLVRLDSTSVTADRDRLKSDILSASLDTARLDAILTEAKSIAPVPNASPEQILDQNAFLASSQAEQNARLSSLVLQKGQKAAEIAVVRQTIAKTNAVMAPLQERVDVRKYLSDQQIGSRLTYLQEFQDLVSQQQDLAIQVKRIDEINAAISALEEARVQAVAEYRSRAFAELTAAQQKVAQLSQDLKKEDERARLLELRAPVDGIVQQLSIHSVGGIVSPAQSVLVVVPSGSKLEIVASLPNHDVGFVHADQPVAVKIDTFDFTQYGLVQGRVINVSADSIAKDSNASARPGDGDVDQTSPSAGRDLNYSVRIALDSKVVQTELGNTDLTAGMAATVEIKTGSRRVISYLLSPIEKRRQEGLHER